MPKLIDANKLKEHYAWWDNEDKEIFDTIVDLQPTIDAEPVRHGHWIERSKVYPDFPYDSTYNYECSNCGYMDTHGADVEVPYCWHCGTKMDEADVPDTNVGKR